MTLQKVINRRLAAGIPGSFYDDSPRRVTPYLIYGDPAPIVGRAFSIDAANPSKVRMGFSKGDVFAGMLATPKQYANYNNLSPTMTLTNGVQGEICSMGQPWIITDHAAKVGYLVCAKSDGSWGAAEDEESIPSGYALIPNAKFILQDAEAGGLARIQLNF
jgi:hypothetical protein